MKYYLSWIMKSKVLNMTKMVLKSENYWNTSERKNHTCTLFLTDFLCLLTLILVRFGHTTESFKKEKRPLPCLKNFGPPVSQPPNSDSFFSSFWQKIFSSWVYKNKKHLSFFILWLFRLKAIHLICFKFCSYLYIVIYIYIYI